MNKNVNLLFKNGCWYANYRVPVRDEHGNVTTKQRQLSTRQRDRKLAQAAANLMREKCMAVFHGTLETRAVALRNTSPTVEAVFEAMNQGRNLISSADRAQMALRIVIAEGSMTGDLEAAALVHASELSKKMIVNFREQLWRNKQHQKHPEDRAFLPRADRTINTLIRGAKSVFSRRRLEAYQAAGLNIPATAIASFMGGTMIALRAEDVCYRPLPEETWVQMDGSVPLMLKLARRHEAAGRTFKAQQWRNAYTAYQIMRRWGLRNSEVVALQWSWFVTRPDGQLWLELIPRSNPPWKPKGKSRAFVVKPDFVKKLQLDRSGPFVLGGTVHDRMRGANHCIGAYVRRFVPREEQQKSAYLLRKQWGSEIAQRHGIHKASYLLGHSSVAVTEAHYASILDANTLPPL